MQVKVQLIKSVGRLSTREPFYLADNDRTAHIVFDTDVVITDAIVEMVQGERSCKLRAHNLTAEGIVVPSDFMMVGEPLQIIVHALSNGIIVRVFHIEPIVFAKFDTGFEGHAEVEEMRNRLEVAEARIEAFTELLSTALKTLAQHEKDLDEIGNIVQDPLN